MRPRHVRLVLLTVRHVQVRLSVRNVILGSLLLIQTHVMLVVVLFRIVLRVMIRPRVLNVLVGFMLMGRFVMRVRSCRIA